MNHTLCAMHCFKHLEFLSEQESLALWKLQFRRKKIIYDSHDELVTYGILEGFMCQVEKKR
jgi:hypothetical protein